MTIYNSWVFGVHTYLLTRMPESQLFYIEYALHKLYRTHVLRYGKRLNAKLKETPSVFKKMAWRFAVEMVRYSNRR